MPTYPFAQMDLSTLHHDVSGLCLLISQLSVDVEILYPLRAEDWPNEDCEGLKARHQPTTGNPCLSDLPRHGAWTVIEKVQMTAFCVQEFIISGLYLYEPTKVLKIVSGGHTRRTMWELFIINVLIIMLDIALLVVEYLNGREYEQTFKGAVYSIKLKLEFAILGKLVHIVRNGNRVLSNAIGDTAEFVDETRNASDVTRIEANLHRKDSRHLWTKEIEQASADHIESVEKAYRTAGNGGDDHIMEEGRGYRGIEEALKDQPTVETGSKTDENGLRSGLIICRGDAADI